MRTPALVPSVLLVSALALSGCSAGSDGEDQVVAPPATAPSVEPSVEPSTAPAAPDSSPTPAGTVIEVTYAGGEVTGTDPRVEVPLGEQVTVRLTSDVAEEIHVHGYDLYVDVPAGGTGETTFVADLPGAYEVELHEAGRPLFQLRVA